MAWNAELKRRKWYCICEINMISLYSKKLYNEWYNSLNKEQLKRLEEYKKRKKEKDKEEIQRFFHTLNFMYKFCNNYYKL